MKSFTTCASVANKFFKVLQGYTKGIRFVAVLTMLLIVGIGQAWAETKTYSYTFSAKQFSANGSKTLSNVSWTLAGDGGYWGYDATKGQQFGSSGDPYKTLTLSTSGISGTITKIIINTSGASSVNASFTVSVGGTQWGNSTKLTTTATAYTFTGSNSGEIKFSYTQTSSKALYIKSISVTYETAASYTVTYNANGGSGTMSNSTGSSIKIKECTFTAPGCKQFTSWNTAANGSGTSYAPNAMVATNLTLYAQWGDLPSYTVKLMDNNEVLTFSCNTPITLPSRVDCDGYGYTFVGWTKTWTEEQEEWTTTAPAIIPVGSYTPTANVNLYPVYTKTETTPGATTTTTDYVLTDLANIKSTDVVVITSKNSSDSYYAMSNNNGTSSAPAATNITVSSSKLSSAPDDKFKWNISNNSGTLTIYPNGTTSTWLYCTSTNNGVRVGTNTAKAFTIDATSGYLKHTGTSRYIGVYNNADWRCYTSVNDNIKNQTLAFFVETTTTTTTSTTTTSYISVPDCTTETAITLKPNGGNGDDKTYTTEETSYTLPACPFSRTGYTFAGWAKSSNGEIEHNDKAELTELDGTPVVLYAQWTANSYTVIFNANGGTGEMDNQSFNYDEEKALSANEFTRKGHTFVNWNNKDDGNGDDFDDEEEVKNLSTINGDTYNLYAQWECVTPTISTQPQSATYLRDDDADALSVVAAASDATLTYQWKSSTDNSTWSDITGATETTYKPSTQSVGTTYYQVVVTNSEGNCSATSDVATITVRSANCKWVETEIGNIDSNDLVVVAMQKTNDDATMTWALNSSNGTNTYPLAEPVNIKNQTIDSDVFDPIIWNISGNATDGYVLYPNGSTTTWLYLTKSNNIVKVGTGADNVFTINNGYLYHINTTDVWAGYLGVSITTNSWRHYTNTTGVIEGQTLKFYRKECLPTGEYWINYDLTNVVCTDDPIKNKISTDDDAVELNFEAVGEHNELPATITVTNGSTTLAKNTDYTWSNGVLTILNPSQITDNITISIAAQKRKYTVTFAANGHGTAPAAQSVTAEGTASEPTAPEATGYTFGGWYKEPECTTAFDFDTPITSDITLYAKWTVNKYTITFKNYDGTELQRSEVAYGETPSYTGETPTRKQSAQYTYTFKGWSPTIASVTQDQVYTAQFTQTTRQYTVTWYDGTGNEHKTQTVDYNTTVALPTTNPEPCDNEYPYFIGWTADPITGSTTTQPELVENVKVTGDCDYYPVFAKGEGGSSDYKLVTSAPADWSGTYLIVNTDDKKAWKGSATSDNGAIDVTITNNTIPSNATTDNETFTIATMTGGYSIKGTSGKYISGTNGSNATNYKDAAQLNTISIDNNNNVTITSNTSVLRQNNSSASLFRYYKSSSYSSQHPIQLYKKGSGVNYTSYITTCCTSWTAPTLTYTTPLNAEERQTAQPQFGNGTTYGNATYTSSNPSVLAVDKETGEVTAVSKGTATVTVTWEGDETYCSISATSNTITVNGSYSVTFHSNGGTGTMEPQKADPSTQCIAKLNKNEFTKADYVFVGWKDASGVAYTDEQENITLTKNITLFAQWAPIVTLNDAGNEETAHPTAVNGTITLPDGANACPPYEFVGWTSVAIADWNEGINEPALVATTYTPNAPTTLYAVYKIQSEGNANAFKLSFEGGNGKTYYVGSYNSSPYLRGYSNITKEEAVTFIRTKMYPDNDTKYYIYMEHKSEYLYYNGTFNSTSSTPDENQGWVFHTVGDKIKLQSTYSYDPDYLSFSDRDQETINISTSASGSEFNMLSAVTSTYVASPLCNQEIEIIFETGNGDFVDNAPATNPLTVSRGDVITLPTCEYPGYEFMGWLKDEQQLDPSDIIGTYYTGDYTVDGVSSTITFYAYYKVIPEEVEFTGKDDVELLMYYDDGTENYYYAVSHAAERGELSSKQNCFNATTWTFTNVGNMQYHIQDETGKYLGAYSDGDNDLILSATPKVWTFTEVNGLWKMVCENSPSRALMYISTGKTFTNAAKSMEGNGAYSYVTLGICPYPTYTTNPVLTQGFVVTNTAMVTSAAGQKVKAANALTLETRNIELPCTFTISAPNITFYDNTGAEVTQLTASAASEQFELYFAYKPTAENTMEYPTITIVDDEMKTYTIKNRIYARSLPNTFAVVAKVGGIWYALPSQGLNSTDALVGYPVEVDNLADPTAVTAVPENADWSLRQVYEASRVDATKDRFVANGENFVFVNNEGTPKALNASASGNYLLTDAQYSGYYETNPGLYEWTPTTSDLETYTLTNAQRTDRTLNVSINTVFGVHYDNKATTEVRFLPIQGRYTPMAAQVVEWKENSVVVMYNGDPAQTASVSVNGGTVQTTELSGDDVQKDIAVYELAADGLATNPTQSLSITIGTEKAILPIPYIVSSETTDLALLPGTTVAARQEVAKVADLVVLKDAKLTAAGAKGNPYKFRNVTIYGGGSLIIPADKGFGANSLTMRVGGVEAGEYVYTYPQLDLNGTINSGNINLDLMTTYDYYYPFSVPYEVTLTDIHYPVEIYGSNVKPTNKGSFLVSYYDGEERAKGNSGWKDVEEQGKTVLSPHVGYSIWGLPKKVSVNGATSDRQTYGIHRIPMKKAAPDVMVNETTNKNVSISAHEATRDNDKGWNFIGNPYLVQHGGLDGNDTDIQMGLLVKEMKDGQWTGGWVFNGEQVRYVTQTDDCLNYTSTPVANATVPAFSAFFIQAKETGAIAFTSPNVAAAQSLTVRRSDENKEITTGIILSGEKHSDRTGLLIAEEFTEAYEFNADLSKFDNQDMNLYTISPSGKLAFMAINEELAKQTIPLGYSVSADGMYTIAFDEQRYNRNDIYALYLIDYDRNETTNLLHMDYDFYSETGANAERFALQVAFAPSTTTDVEYTQVGDILVSREGNTLQLDNLPSDVTVTVYDAVGHLIEQHTASQLLQLTLQKGYYLLHIGNNQHSVVIDTFIP